MLPARNVFWDADTWWKNIEASEKKGRASAKRAKKERFATVWIQ